MTDLSEISLVTVVLSVVYTPFDLVLIPPLNRGAADTVRDRELALAHPAIVGFKHLQAIRFRGTQARAYSWKLMSEVTVAVLTVVLGYAQVQNHDLIALAGVF